MSLFPFQVKKIYIPKGLERHLLDYMSTNTNQYKPAELKTGFRGNFTVL